MKMKKNNSILLPMVVLGTLFFIFGLVSWVNSILIPYFKAAFTLNHTQSYLVAFAFYIAYLVMSIPNSKLLTIIGHQKGMVAGLWMMAIGTFLFVPAAKTESYPLFLTGLFVIGTGLSMLQTVANPYVTVIGPIETAARRISIVGLCNKIAGILAPLVFAAVILKGGSSEADLSAVVMPYSVLSGFLFLFGCGVLLMKLPEISNGAEKEGAKGRPLWSYPYFVLGVIALFAHVAEQIVSIDTVISYAQSMGLTLQEAKIFPSITLGCSLIGYFAGIIAIPRFASQKQMLRIAVVTGLVLSTLVLIIPGTFTVYGHAVSLSLLCINGLGFCNALIYAGIWPLAIHDLGKKTDLASACMVMALCGNGLMPLLYGVLADNWGLRPGYIVLLPCFIYLIYYAYRGYKIEKWGRN
ncbi:MAG: sugar MFS transporter [Bacteroidales bacterium]|nr:sugar MFS transporter [Bacteroidales bacterium]